jgi:hypothetical protein
VRGLQSLSSFERKGGISRRFVCQKVKHLSLSSIGNSFASVSPFQLFERRDGLRSRASLDGIRRRVHDGRAAVIRPAELHMQQFVEARKPMLTEAEVLGIWSGIRDAESSLCAALAEVDLRLSAHRSALMLGLRSGDDLERRLKKKTLPRFRPLRDWWYVDLIASQARLEGSLASLASRHGKNASVYFRFLQRVTGDRWSTVRSMDQLEIRRRAIRVWLSDRDVLGISRDRLH